MRLRQMGWRRNLACTDGSRLKPTRGYATRDLVRTSIPSMILCLLTGCASLRAPAPVAVAPSEMVPKAATVVLVYDVDDQGSVLPDSDRAQLSTFFRGKVDELSSFQAVPEAKVRAQITDDKRATYAANRDEASQIALGKAVSATHIVRPTLLKLGDECTTTVALYDLETESRVNTRSVNGACGVLAQRDALESLAKALSQAPGAVDVEGSWQVTAKTLLGSDNYRIEVTVDGAALVGMTASGDRWQGRLDGRTFTGTWNRNGTTGRMRITWSKDGKRFSGAYGLGQGSIDWPMQGQR